MSHFRAGTMQNGRMVPVRVWVQAAVYHRVAPSTYTRYNLISCGISIISAVVLHNINNGNLAFAPW